LSQVLRNATAVSCQDSLRAQWARNSGLGQLMFADRPWQFFNPHAAGSAIDPPHAVK
jgi:hypothetical protein